MNEGRLESHVPRAAPRPPTMAGEFPAFSYAFQPIVDTASRSVFSNEALIRGPQNESAFSVLNDICSTRLHEFDQLSRLHAISLAERLAIDCNLNLNFLPQGLFVLPESIAETLATAALHGLPAERLILEVTEGEMIDNHARFAKLLNAYRGEGLKFAIDDFGAGYSGLNLLADFQPDQVKIDMNLVRGIHAHGPRQAIVRAIIQVCMDLGIDVIAEGVESVDEFNWLAAHEVHLFQGYLFAKPAFECLPDVRYLDLQ